VKRPGTWFSRSDDAASDPSVDKYADESPTDYSARVARESWRWYKDHAIRSRKAYKVSETFLVLLGAAIPTSAVIFPDTAAIPAVLGAGVVVTTGLRSVFHWQDNYLRFSAAREAVEEQRRLYKMQSSPYEDPTTRDQLLIAAVTRIEQDEMGRWIKVASKPPTPARGHEEQTA
jgi:uncharacterized protein DUF4231